MELQGINITSLKDASPRSLMPILKPTPVTALQEDRFHRHAKVDFSQFKEYLVKLQPEEAFEYAQWLAEQEGNDTAQVSHWLANVALDSLGIASVVPALENLDVNFRTPFEKRLLSLLAYRNPLEATKFWKDYTILEQREAIPIILKAWAVSDPRQAFESLLPFVQEQENQGVFADSIRDWFRSDLNASLEWVASLRESAAKELAIRELEEFSVYVNNEDQLNRLLQITGRSISEE